MASFRQGYAASAMTAARQLGYSYEDFLRTLDSSEIKLEYSAGLIYAVAGGTVPHGQLSVNASSLLRAGLRGRCIVVSSDVKVRVERPTSRRFPMRQSSAGRRRLPASTPTRWSTLRSSSK
jgi:hypothetical protein